MAVIVMHSKQNNILSDSQAAENLQASPAATLMLVGGSQAPNGSSFPKNNTTNTENNIPENPTPVPYENRCEQCALDLMTKAGKALNMLYPREYKTWSNCKHRSKSLKGITGSPWSHEFDSFPGFLRVVKPIPEQGDSLDRIDPSYGYIVGNLRWASKQLQSDNRKNVEQFMVRGIPMTKPQLADLLGITYDCLRMKLSRGETIENIIAETIKVEKPSTKKRKPSVSECPWYPGTEREWERAFQQEYPKDKKRYMDARVNYFIQKCKYHLSAFEPQVEIYRENMTPDCEIPEDWLCKFNHWKDLLMFANGQLSLVLAEHEHKIAIVNLGPT